MNYVMMYAVKYTGFGILIDVVGAIYITAGHFNVMLVAKIYVVEYRASYPEEEADLR